MAEKEKKLSEEYFLRAWDELSTREISSSENLDRAILSTSLAILGAAFALLKYSQNIFCAMGLFYISALILLVAIISVTISLRIAMLSTREMKKLLNEYRAGGKKSDSKWNKYIAPLNRVSFWCYLVGVISMACFFGLNL